MPMWGSGRLPTVREFIDQVLSEYPHSLESFTMNDETGQVEMRRLTRRLSDGRVVYVILPTHGDNDTMAPNTVRNACLLLDIPVAQFGIDPETWKD